MSNKIFIIEHLDGKLGDWSLIEYKEISKIVGKNRVWFTNILKEDIKKLTKFGKVFEESVKKMKLDSACVLDPESKKLLTPVISKKIDYYIIGGILGDHPPRKRTEEELTQFLKKFPAFNIGKEQFSTDNAVFVVNEIINGKEFNKMEFKDELTIQIDKIQSTILPYRYPIINGKAHISQELVKYIKKQDSIS